MTEDTTELSPNHESDLTQDEMVEKGPAMSRHDERGEQSLQKDVCDTSLHVH